MAGFTPQLRAANPLPGNFTQGIAATSGDTPAQVETIPLQVTATQTVPPSITIESWVPGTFSIYRKAPSDTTWTSQTSQTLAANGTWTDTNVSVGTLYEYKFVNTAASADYNGNYPSGYILCGIQVDQTLPKGHIAVIVASDLPVNLPTEYAQYKADLLDDGWIVNEIQVPRAANYNGVGITGIGTVKVNTAGTTSAASGSIVHLTNSSGKTAVASLGVSGGAISSATIQAGGCGTGFTVGDVLTVSGGSIAGSGANLTANVGSTQTTLSYASPITGGSGYTDGQTVTLTGQSSGKTAQCTLSADSNGAIDAFFIASSQTGFIPNEALTMTGNSTGSGLGALGAYVPTTGTSAGQLAYVYIYASGTGYTQGETGTVTGVTSGKTAQVTLSVINGHINFLSASSSQTGFIDGENLVLSGTATGSGAPLFTGSYSATGSLQSVTVAAGGTGYTNGASVIFSYGSATAQGTITASNGVITGATVTSSTTGFSAGGYLTLLAVTSGYNLTVSALDTSDIGRAVVISAGGSGYSDNDTVTIKGNASGLTAIGSLIVSGGAVTGVSAVLPGTFTAGESLTITPTLGGTGLTATAGSSTSYHLLIRSAVQALYAAYPQQLKNISIVGKVPVCRSGINDGAGSDGHGNECSYATDAFYAEMNAVVGTNWTDTQDNTSSPPLGDYNQAGDGQYDQQHIYEVDPAGVQLGFGRIDLSLSIQTEIEAERTYFGKLHRYKIADPSFLPGRYVCDRLTYANEREADLQALPGIVGMSNIEFITTTNLPTVSADQDADQLYTTQNGPFLFYFKGSGGPGPGVNGKAVFWTGMQSHWGYWYQSNLVSSGSNDMELRLAENSFTLDFTWNIWGLRYIYHRMGMGLDAGDMLKTSINNQNVGSNAGPYNYKFNNTSNGDYSGVLYMAQMGDPALRLFMFAPPTSLSVVSTAGQPVLTWTASTDPTVTGYHVYRATYLNAPFTRLTTSPIATTTYTDTTATPGNYVYMVRAVRLESTGGGSFYNASLGTTQSFNLGGAPTPITIQTTSLPTSYWQTSGSTKLAASGGVPQYTWTETGALPAGLTLSPLGVLSGIPTDVGTFPITVKATDQINQTATQALTITVNADTSTVIYPEQTTWTNKSLPTTSYGTTETTQIAGAVGQNEAFHRYDLSGVNLYNGFQKATLYLYVTNSTAAGTFAPVQASLIADSADGWISNGIAKPFSGASNNGSGKTRINCPNHGFITGTLVSIAGLTGSGAPTTGPYAVTNVDANDFDLLTVTYNSSWAYDPALAFATTQSMTYNTRPTTYDANVPTLTATGTDTPGTLLQVDVTPYVKEVIKNNFANFPSKKMGIRFFTGTAQTVYTGSLNSFGNAIPYMVIQTTNAPNITVNSPTQNPVSVNVGSSIYLNTTVTALPARAANLTLQWSQVSGPGTATFTNATSASTGVSFSAAGQYVVQLTANDGVAQSYQTFTINVLTIPLGGPTDSMVLRLPFDETTGTTAYDYSGATPANNGTLTADPGSGTLPTWQPSGGKIAGALSFAGTNGNSTASPAVPANYQQVVVPDSTTLDGMKQLSISFWFYANSLPYNGSSYGNSYAGLIVKRAGSFSKESYTVQLRGSSATAATIYADIGGTGTTSLAGPSITTGQWYHCVFMFDGTQSTNNQGSPPAGPPTRWSVHDRSGSGGCRSPCPTRMPSAPPSVAVRPSPIGWGL